MVTPQRTESHGGDGRVGASDPSVKDLIKRLANEATGLVRSEVALAKLEMREAGRLMALDAARVGAAIALAAVGGLALTACAILLLGGLFGGAYWAASLVVGITLLSVGGVLAQRGIRGLQRHELKPEATLETLREDGSWAGEEARRLKERLSS